MGGRALIWTGQIRGSSNTSLSGLINFCMDSFTTCFSPDADQLCAPVGLSALSALLLLLSSLVFMYQRYKFRGEHPGEAATYFYCFLGNLCSTIGTILSRQLDIQVLMSALAAAVDVLNFISIFLPVCMCWNSKAERRRRVVKKRRRQHLLVLCVLMVVGGGFLTFRMDRSQVDMPLTGRRLLHAPLHGNTEVLGYTLGLLSLFIACTSKFPALCRARRGELVTKPPVLSGLLCSSAGALYASSILLYSTQFEFVVRVMPWLLSAICCATLELLILLTYWCRRGSRKHPRRFSPDTESLLRGLGSLSKDSPAMKRQTKQQVCLQEVMVSREEALESEALKRTVQVVRVDGLSSDSSYDSSSVASELEWDFEEADTQWNEVPARQDKGDEFPMQEWPKNPQPFGICTCGMSGLPAEMTVPGKVRERGSVTDMAP